MRYLNNSSPNFFCCVLVPDTTESSTCLHRHVNCARMVKARRKLPVSYHRCHEILTRNIEALCGFLRSIHDFVQNDKVTLALVVLTWHLDHDSATCTAMEMRFIDVVECQTLLSSRSVPLASHTSIGHDLEAFEYGRDGKRAARVFWCQLAHSLGFLCNQSGSDEWIRGNFMVNLWFPHQHQLIFDGVKRQSSDFIV